MWLLSGPQPNYSSNDPAIPWIPNFSLTSSENSRAVAVSNTVFVPVTVLTGFLGSGKTTLLRRLLRSRRMASTAVLINEFGEVALDHLLVKQIDTSTVVLQNGCICCTIRHDLSQALRDLYAKAVRGEIKRLDRVVVETTGLADPAPIISTIMTDPVLRHHFRMSNVIATVDAVNASRQFNNNPESVKQAAVADRLILTKTDLVTPAIAEVVRQNLARLNPSAPILDANADRVAPSDLLSSDLYDLKAKIADVRHWLEEEPERHASNHDHGTLGRHAAEITSFHLTFAEPLDWTAFGIWLTMLLNRHGERVLRVKGFLSVLDSSTPVCINGVQHLVHTPFHLEDWPTPDRRSRLVFIVRGMDPAAIRRSLLAFNRLAVSELCRKT
jgi:G3E family GTPase